MQKRTIVAKLASLYAKNGNKAPGWKALEKEGIDEDDIFDYWDFITEALDDALGKGWRASKTKSLPTELDDADEPAPKGHHDYSVYVVDLDDAVKNVGRFAEKNPKGNKGCVYVGQTWHLPKERFQQHLDGYKSCPLVHKYGKRLNKALTKEGQFETREEAEKEEGRFAKELRRRGYRVWSN